jgi:signal transduction histidine kinase
MNPQWTLRRRVAALGLLMATVLTFLAAGATTTAIANRDQLDKLVDTVGPMRAASDQLLAALVNQETGVRGFVLHGSAEDLAPYQKGLDDERTAAAVIASSPAATADIKQDLTRVTRLAAAWRATVAEPAIAAVRSQGTSAGQAILNDLARQQFDAIRAAVVGMQDRMRVVRDDAVASIRGSSTTLLFVLIVATVLVIATCVGLLVALQRTVIGPVTDLAVQVRSVARGNYGLAITETGPPELERLARDVDAMRQKIASDLAEVEAARIQIEETNLLLEQQAAELVRSNRDLEQFAYVASHDLQEPLRKVASFCQLLQRRYAGQLDERADQYIAFAVNGAQRMQRLINDLLAFSRIGRMTARFAEVDLDRIVADAVGQLDGAREAAGAEITWSGLPTVRGEETLLTNLVINLIGNSLKFRRPDEPCRVHISGRRVDDSWEISCVDNGIGIEREFADKVFVIFQRLHPRDAYPGTGIGLAVAKKIVEYHGGRIWTDTEHRVGAAIRFTFPMAAEPVEVTESAAPIDPTPQPDYADRVKESVA